MIASSRVGYRVKLSLPWISLKDIISFRRSSPKYGAKRGFRGVAHVTNHCDGVYNYH